VPKNGVLLCHLIVPKIGILLCRGVVPVLPANDNITRFLGIKQKIKTAAFLRQ
jgi:hypothetical protein